MPPTVFPSEECPNAKRAFNAEGEIVRLACDLWSCDYCRKILAWRWAQTVRYGIALWPSRAAFFWTLTLPAWVPTAEAGYKILPERWDNFRRNVQRAQSEFHYCAFVEAHPHRSFIPHFHIITLHEAPQRLKDLAVRSGFGYQAKEVKIDGKAAVSYVSKYASKGSASIPRNFRRVRLSRRWPRLPLPEYSVEVYPPGRGEALAEYLRRCSVALGCPVGILRDRYLDHTRDIH